jgi:hypothetical protein
MTDQKWAARIRLEVRAPSSENLPDITQQAILDLLVEEHNHSYSLDANISRLHATFSNLRKLQSQNRCSGIGCVPAQSFPTKQIVGLAHDMISNRDKQGVIELSAMPSGAKDWEKVLHLIATYPSRFRKIRPRQ